MSATQAKNEIYEPKKLDAIYQNILANQSIGKSQDYEIRIDNFPAVGKNNDPERFMSYSEFITPDTKCVSVFLYRNNGQSDKYFFFLQPASFQQAEQLKGFDFAQSKPIDEIELKERISKDFKNEELLRENAALKKEIAEYEIVVKNMDQDILDAKAGKHIQLGNILELLGNTFFGETIKKAKDNLSGVNQNTGNETGQGTFKRKGEPQDIEPEEETEPSLSDRDRGYIKFIDDVRTRIGDVELANVMHLLDLVASHPPAINYAIKLVTNFLKQKQKEINNEDEKI